MKTKLGNQKLYGLVNNAGVGGSSKDVCINTNIYGTKNMTDAFLPLLEPNQSRIVNLGSGAGPMYVVKCETEAQKFLTTEDITWQQLDAHVKEVSPKLEGFPVYGLTKAVIHKYTAICAKENPNLMISACTPGLVETNMTKDVPASFGEKITPEQGAKSTLHCLFNKLDGNGWYYGSDAIRSPLHVTRSPGEPAYTGE